ncbi:MAG: hypothetical protein HY238_04430 [Acidobacteria bacterium]|nr:hypothetical protein [Acidobacteriota bacterium]
MVGSVSGYSTQAQVSLDIAEIINNRRIRFWFAAEFNPIENDPTSRPLCLYEQLDRAFKNQDPDSAKACSIADNLRVWIQRWAADGLIDADAQARALFGVRTAAADGGFRPVVFFLAGLNGVIREEQPDEYRVENQPLDAPNVHRILPFPEDDKR